MSKYMVVLILKRIATSLIVLFLLITFIFILIRISPGDPTQKFVSPELSPELAIKVKESFGLNTSIISQYKSFLGNMISGDFGVSYNYKERVLAVIAQYLPFTIIFSLISFCLQLTLGGFLAVLAVQKLNRPLDKILTRANLILYALPSFVIGVFLILLFSEIFGLLPSSGLRSYDFDSFSGFEKAVDYCIHLIMPVATLSLGGIPVFFRYLRDGIEEAMNKPFILNLRANGYNERTILLKHLIPNAVSPLIVAAGVELGILLGGALITEVIFSLPGMGRLTINAILLRDYPLIIGCTFTAGVMVIISNLIADVLKAKIDKRLTGDILN